MRLLENRKLLVLFMLWPLAACVEVADISKEGAGRAGPLQFQAVEGLQPDQYSIIIPLQEGEVAVRKIQDFNKLASTPIQLLGQFQTQIVDEKVTAGEKYFYQLGSIENGGLSAIRTVEVIIPKDRVFAAGDHGIQASDLAIEYGRIFFLKGSRVRTNGANWDLKARKIISQDGEIYSFPEGVTAAGGADGRSGGEIRISALEIQGVLNVTLRGEHGGQGKPGDELPTRGAQGASGKPGQGFRSGIEREYFCTEKAVSPGDGAPGVKKGNRGYDGGRGGDSGNVYVFVPHETGAVQANFYEGLGGLPGDGGPGERGGAPGDFDQKKNFRACDYRKAHEGPRGPQGEQGSLGRPGLRGKICRQIGKQKMECRQGF